MAEIVNTLNILQHNVLSWSGRRLELSNIYRALDPHLILINAHGCRDQEEIKIYNYRVLMNNITNQPHDGAAIAIRKKEARMLRKGLKNALGLNLNETRQIYRVQG